MAEDDDTDDKPVTGATLATAFDKLADRLAAVTAPAQPVVEKAPEQPREYTRAELDALVEEGKINRVQADAQLDKQLEAKVTARVTANVTRAAAVETVNAAIDGYMAKVPALADKTSIEFKRVTDAFNDLVKHGSPDTKATELAALRIALPAVDLGAGRREDATSPEVGGGRPPPRRQAADREDQPPADMPARNRQHYESLIAKGVMADWKAVREEWKHRKPAGRAA